MDKLRSQKYAESLDRVIQNNHVYLKGLMTEFAEKCMLVASSKTAPPRILVEIPETYRSVQNRLNEIRAVQQLLRAKYFIYARKDPRRDQEISDLGNTAKTAYSKFEHSLKQTAEIAGKREEKSGPFAFFRDEENQVMFLRNWRILQELGYEISASRVEEKREVTKDKPRSLTLFVFKGEPKSVDELQSRMVFREHDVIERHNPEEIRGLLTHLREVQPGEVEKIFERFKALKGYASLKCLLIAIRSQRDYEGDIAGAMQKAFTEMEVGQVKTLSIARTLSPRESVTSEA
jgi:hypothetical protein